MKRSKLNLAVVGVGHLGRHHARISASREDVDLVAVVDTHAEQAEAIAAKCGQPTQAFTRFDELLEGIDSGRLSLDGVVVAVPTTWHVEIAGPLLDRQIATLIEKPLARTVAEAEDLNRRADRAGVVLQVGHIERFNPALKVVEQLTDTPRFLDVERRGLYTFRSTDIGVVLDLMVHDLDLVAHLIDSPLRSVDAVGVSVISDHEDVVNARLTFVNGAVVNIDANRVSPTPRRSMRLWSRDGYATLDFQAKTGTIIRPSEAWQRGDVSVTDVDRSKPEAVRDHLFGRVFDVENPTVEQLVGEQANAEPLALELEDFVSAIRTGRSPRVNGQDGLRAIQLAEAVLDSVRRGDESGRSSIEPAA